MLKSIKFSCLAAVCCLIITSNSFAYLNQEDAEFRTQQIVSDLFKWQNQNEANKKKIQYFIEDFCKATFTNDVYYGQFNDENVARMVIEQAAEKVAEWSNSIVLTEVTKDANLNQQFNGANYKHLTPLRKAVRHAILEQAKRTSKKPLELIRAGEFSNFIGAGLEQKVKEQINNIINRSCAAYCGNDEAHNEILLDCGHKLHPQCLQSIITATSLARAKCPVCPEKLSAYASKAAAAQSILPQANRPVFSTTRPSMPQPSAPPAPTQGWSFTWWK